MQVGSLARRICATQAAPPVSPPLPQVRMPTHPRAHASRPRKPPPVPSSSSAAGPVNLASHGNEAAYGTPKVQPSLLSDPKSLKSGVVIVGAGPAGLATAMLLAKQGWTDITILEHKASIDAEEGEKSYVYMIDGRGRQLLELLGLEDKLEDAGVSMSSISVTKSSPDLQFKTSQVGGRGGPRPAAQDQSGGWAWGRGGEGAAGYLLGEGWGGPPGNLPRPIPVPQPHSSPQPRPRQGPGPHWPPRHPFPPNTPSIPDLPPPPSPSW